jgi:hypothetical protein
MLPTHVLNHVSTMLRNFTYPSLLTPHHCHALYTPTIPNFPIITTPLPLKSVIPQRPPPNIAMNATSNTLQTLYQTARSTLASRFTYVQTPHIKLKAEHQALVLFHIVKFLLAYWEGWKDGKKDKGKREERKKRSKGKMGGYRRKKRKYGVVGRGKYTVVFQWGIDRM